jgi:hypothetical protein
VTATKKVPNQEKRYKVILTEDESTVARGFQNAISATKFMEHHQHYSVLDRKEWKVVLDLDPEEGTKKVEKKPKPENPLVLNAEVVGGNWRHRRLGRIVKVTKSLLTVQWDGGIEELFGRSGRPFHGRIDREGEAVKFTKSGQLVENLWGTEDEPGIEIATDSHKARIAEEKAAKKKSDEEREAKRKAVEEDPAYQQRQSDLKRYSEMLQGLGANVENSWNDQKDFRIELDGIKPDRMEKLVAAIREALK